MTENRICISVIGCGNVGNALALLLLNRSKQPVDLNIMEPDNRNDGRILELQHIAALYGSHTVSKNSGEKLLDAQVVFHTAGAGKKITGDRMEVAEDNVRLTRELFLGTKFKYSPYIVVLSNPVDIITYFVQHYTSAAPGKVFGTGTMLDSARLSSLLVERGYTTKPIRAFVVGEHGNTMVPLFSRIREITLHSNQQKHLEQETIYAAQRIKQTQDATSTGVASCALFLMDYLLKEDQSTPFSYPVCCQTDKTLNTFLGLKESIALSWFYTTNGKSYFPFACNSKEVSALKNSANYVSEVIRQLKEKGY